MNIKKRIGVSLSGGGYRASAFHLGTLSKLHELGILQKTDVLSSISGGSITSAYYCLKDQDFETFKKEMVEKLTTKDVISYILHSTTFIKLLFLILIFVAAFIYVLFTPYAYLSPLVIMLLLYILIRYQFKIFPVSDVIEKAYDKFFYENKTLGDFKSTPRLAIGATNLQTSRPFVFSQDRMGDSLYDYMEDAIPFKHKEFPISKAVMASSCVPFAFTPISIAKKYFEDPDDFERIDPKIVDGGVYDNQGIHKITQEHSSYKCNIIITSDAGNKLPFAGAYNNTFTLLLRTVDVFMARIKHFQMSKNLYENAGVTDREIAYLSLGWDIEKCIPGFVNNLKNGNIVPDVIKQHELKTEWIDNPQAYEEEIAQHLQLKVDYKKILANNLNEDDLKIARSVSTNLKALKKKQVEALMIHAENLTELLVKLYCPLAIIK
ncbi:MAG: patatin-like phospholipase family protein [Chitinophagales bacterium]|nr:patatin-like phospholipase family protein [Chitinophagaceae bacterium]MCB9065476.1 patatin-like phospholipase family protein [Chitinophagales bacterium]